jgi:site-specific DNA-methyltransferase (adenine-specific)
MTGNKTREVEFRSIKESTQSYMAGESPSFLVLQGDSLEVISKFPNQSVSLILTDPPYHSTKKSNITGDTAFEEDEHFLEWMESFAKHWQRILKLNGTLYLFCSAQMSARLEVLLSQYFRPISHITWTKPNDPGFDGWKGKMKKESLRHWYPHSERILVFEHGSYGKAKATRRAPLGQFLFEARTASGLSMKELTEVTGAYGNVNHGGAVANWEAGRNIPSREQYAKLSAAILATGKVESMPPFEDLIRPMFVDGNMQFTDVWDFKSVKPFKGKHPAEKPQDLLMHIIAASSYPNDIVLDCFAGSGSTALAAIKLGRKAIGIEIESEWIKRANNELERQARKSGIPTVVKQISSNEQQNFERLFED